MKWLLIVEGGLDKPLLDEFVIEPNWATEARGSKTALPHEARRELNGHYLRDRDFDHEPPIDRSTPTVHGLDPLGWRWVRHEIENYLLEPGIASAALGVDPSAWSDALLDAATRICDYEAARWVLGAARRVLPPTYRLNTYPKSCKKDFKLPTTLDAESQIAWMTSHAEAFRARVEPVLADERLRDEFRSRARELTAITHDIDEVLVWFSGKDLLGGCREWLAAHGQGTPEKAVERIRDWMKDNPDEARAHLPEWAALRQMLRQRAAGVEVGR